MPHSQGLSKDPYPEPNQSISSYLRSTLAFSSYFRLDFPKGLFPVGLNAYLLYGITALEEFSPPSNEGLFI